MKKEKATKEKKLTESIGEATHLDAVDSAEVISTEEKSIAEESNEKPEETEARAPDEKSSTPDEENLKPQEENSFMAVAAENIDTDESTDEPALMDNTVPLVNLTDDVANGDNESAEQQENHAEEKLPLEEKLQEEKAVEVKSAEGHDNVAYVNTQLEKLISLRDAHNFVDFWFYVKELNKMIFTLRGLHKEERSKFKDRIGELCEETKKVQDEVKAKVAKTSHLKLDRIQQLLDEALAFGNNHDELEKSFLKIEEASKFFREGKVTSEDGEESADMSREHKEKAKEIIKTAKDKIFDRKREVRESNFKKVTDRLNAISDSLLSQGRAQKVFDGVKNLRNEMKSMNLDRSQLREIDNVIETLWKKAREKSNTGRVVDAKKRISGMEDLRRRKEIFIKTLEQEIKELNSKWSSNVKNDFFKNRVNEWIEEKKAKIEETRKELESLQDKIKFLQEQMNRT